MKELVNSLKGDKVIWAFVALLALFSFMPVFSASSNLAYMRHGSGNAFTYLLKHAAQVLVGFFILYKIHKVPYHYFKTISKILLPVVWALLIYTLLRGTVVEGANASRWIQIPFIGITFQTSTLASIVLYVFVARYLSKKRETPITFQNSLWELWTPVFVTLIFILPANLSTAALIFSMVLMLVFIGKYPLKYIGIIVGAGIIGLTFFILVAKAFPDAFPNRVDTWIARIDNCTSDKPDEDDYQIEKAKIAIASGGIYGLFILPAITPATHRVLVQHLHIVPNANTRHADKEQERKEQARVPAGIEQPPGETTGEAAFHKGQEHRREIDRTFTNRLHCRNHDGHAQQHG